jgi:hypothetical protein
MNKGMLLMVLFNSPARDAQLVHSQHMPGLETLGRGTSFLL